MFRPALFIPLLLISSALFAAESAPALGELTYSGDQAALESLDREINAAGNDATKLAAIEQRLLELLRRTDLTFAARQAAAQRLGLVLAAGPAKPTASALKPLPTMLTEERDSDLARLALEPAPGDAIDAVFVAPLASTAGRIRLGIIDSIGRRRIASAVPELAKLLAASDSPTAAAAARALGTIGNAAALAALQTQPEPSSDAVASAKLAAATRLAPSEAMGVLNDLQRNAADPSHRVAAFRVSLDLEPATAATRLAEILGGRDWTMKQAALEAIFASRAPNLGTLLAGRLASWDAPTQVAVISALARRGEESATPAFMTASESSEPEVRLAAITALGAVPGTRDTVTFLVKIISGADGEAAKAARQSLTRLTGPDVSLAILAGAERGDPAQRVVFLEQLGLRNMTEALPMLLRTRADPSATVRTAAIGALGDLAPATEQKALLDWTIEAADPDEQARALRSLVNVTLRNPDVAERGRPIFALIETAQPALAVRLLPALGRLGGAASAQAAARLAVRSDPKVAEPATAILTRWTDAAALPAYTMVAESAALPASKAAALEAALRYWERNRDPWNPETTTLVARLLASTKDVEPRKKLVALLHRANDQKAVALAETLKADPDLAADIAITADIIKANLAGPPALRASNANGLANILDGKTGTRWTSPLLGAEWIEADFHLSRPLQRITLDQTARAAEFPEHYEVFVTDDPRQPGKPVASGKGQRNKTVIDLPAGTRGRYLILKNTAERKDAPWSICELWID